MKLISLAVLLSCSMVFAMSSSNQIQKNDQKKIDSLVTKYIISKNLKQKAAFENLQKQNHPIDCYPGSNPSSCMDAACEKLGSFGCDTQSEISTVAQACRGVDGACLQSVCKRLGSFGCDTMTEIQSAAATCQNVFDERCVNVVCDRLGSFGCDTMSEINQVGNLCKGRVDSDCIQSVCTRLGTFSCDTISELEQVAKSCSGTN